MDIKEEYNPYIKTALKRNKLSKPMRILKERSLLNGNIIDFGCGNGDDVNILKTENCKIEGYDKFNSNFKYDYLLELQYDVVTCNYVFNTIPELDTHEETLKLIKRLGQDVYISVRSDIKAINSNWIWSDDECGWWTSKGSFQRFYDEELISKLFGDVEYIHSGNDFKLFKLNK